MNIDILWTGLTLAIVVGWCVYILLERGDDE